MHDKKKKPVILINGIVQKEIVPALSPYFEIKQWTKSPIMPLDILEKEIPFADALILAYNSKLPSNIIEKGKNLKIIVQHFVGYENVDISACTKYNIPFCNTSSASINTVAELAIAFIFLASRHIIECNQYVKNGDWLNKKASDFLFGYDINGATLGILGMGKIGFSIAKKAQNLGMNILYHNRRRHLELENNKLKFADLNFLCQKSDIIVNVLPSSKQTYHMISMENFRQMKRNCIFINVGRGDTIVTEDLISALEKKYISQAVLDVFEVEPLDNRSVLSNLPNVICTPHIGSNTEKTRLKKSEITIQNILNFFSNKELIDCVNPEVLKK
jgi:glyoxylate reductase